MLKHISEMLDGDVAEEESSADEPHVKYSSGETAVTTARDFFTLAAITPSVLALYCEV